MLRSGGKSTFLRCLNRMNDVIDIARVEGDLRLDGMDIYDRQIDVVELRAKVVAQEPVAVAAERAHADRRRLAGDLRQFRAADPSGRRNRHCAPP